MADRMQAVSGLSTRQKATAGIFVLVVLFLVWQVYGMFGSSGTAAITPAPSTPNAAQTNMNLNAPGGMPPQQAQAQQSGGPQPSQLPKQRVTSEREAELVRMQQETEAKYIAALNELQMLRVSRDIAEANQAIMKAKLDTVTSQKSIVELLTKPAPQATPTTYQGLLNQGGQQQPQTVTTTTTAQPEASYTVISVSQLQYRWNAVLGSGGNLYNVSVGDILGDGSIVIRIDKSGVILEKDKQRKKISLVPVI